MESAPRTPPTLARQLEATLAGAARALGDPTVACCPRARLDF